MKLLRTVILGVLFLLGVFLSSANTGSMKIVYLPPMPFGPMPEGASIEVPVFIVILGSILVGVLITGLGVAFEQSKLRWSTRSALKQAKRQEAEWGAANRDVASMKEQVANANGETERVRAKLREAEAQIVKLKPPSPAASLGTSQGALGSSATSGATGSAADAATSSVESKTVGESTSGRG